MPRSEPPQSALVELPSWLWAGDPRGYFAAAQFTGAVVDKAKNLWRVKTTERNVGQRSFLVSVDHIAGPGIQQPRFDRLRDLAKAADDDGNQEQRVDVAIARIRSRAERATSSEPTAAFTLNQLLTAVAPGEQLPALALEVFEGLRDVTAEEDPSRRLFANAAVHVVRREGALVSRLQMPLVWSRVAYDARLAAGDTSHLQATLAGGGLAFAASRELADGILIFDAYLGPLLGALTPAVWALAAYRKLGTIIYSLGQPLAGGPGEPAELLQTVTQRGALSGTPVPRLSATASTEAVSWWTRGLSALFGVLSDPAVFTQAGGYYVSTKQFQAVLTIEQLFRRVTSIQTAHRDTNARRVLLFTVLDTLERLTGRDLEVLCTLTFAQDCLESLRKVIPMAAAEVLLPTAERAVAALEQVQNGFFLQHQAGTSTIDIAHADGRVECLSLARAAAKYIKVLRDATHGHGSKKAGSKERANALLAHHDGAIPHDLGLLGYLYLIDLMANTDSLRLHLYGGGRG